MHSGIYNNLSRPQKSLACFSGFININLLNGVSSISDVMRKAFVCFRPDEEEMVCYDPHFGQNALITVNKIDVSSPTQGVTPTLVNLSHKRGTGLK